MSIGFLWKDSYKETNKEKLELDEIVSYHAATQASGSLESSQLPLLLYSLGANVSDVRWVKGYHWNMASKLKSLVMPNN